MDNLEQAKYIAKEIDGIDSQIKLLQGRKVKLAEELNKSNQSPLLPEGQLFINKSNSQVDNFSSKSQKIILFRDYFRGRDDVFAHRWVSKKTGKSGYSFVCKNEWTPRICNKPMTKCSDCPNREHVPLDDEVVRKHLGGIHAIGIYPMLKNENCYFLIADFDKEGWMEDVCAFKETCLEEGVPIVIERSRSGNGAHAWIFFSEEVPAAMARRLGSFLLTKTMSKRYQLDMKSYDRLFPNQDTLPKGGFGNLIALPFQKESTMRGNSLFIDESGKPFEDQWKHLSSIQRMSLLDVERMTKEASKNNQIIGVKMSPMDEEDPPWTVLPSGKRRYKTEIADLPSNVELVLANRIYIRRNNLPSTLLNQLKRLAAFQNPEFYKKQAMRLSTFSTPRVICCAERVDEYLALPRGCFEDVCAILNEYGVEIGIKDERFIGQKVKFKFNGQLTRKQQNASKKILKHDMGIFAAPPGIGKTVLAINAITKRKSNVLILVHRKPLMEQWRMQLASYLGIDLKEIGQIGSGKDKSTGVVDVAMIQSMERKGVVDDRIADYGFVIVDECHHISAVSFERVMMQSKAKYVLGLTATPYRRDGHQPVIHMQCGPITCYIKLKDVSQHISQYSIVSRMTEFAYDWSDESRIQDLWPELINHSHRNEMIVKDVIESIGEGRFPIILTERREHLRILEERLKDKIEHLTVLHGGLRPKTRKEIMDTLRDTPVNGGKAILATGSYIGEGFDEPRLDTLFITMPVSFKGKLVQYAGRLHREYQGKKDVCIYDYVDCHVSVLTGMYRKRLKAYKAMGYEEG